MTGRKRRRKFTPMLTLATLVFPVFLGSCVSSQVTEIVYRSKEPRLGGGVSCFLESFAVTSYDFIDEEEVRAIMDRKLAVALMSEPGVSLGAREETNASVLLPELIIKRYQQRYTERYYYLMSVRVVLGGELLGHYTYEYNGTSSIFDGKVQTALITRFIDDFVKREKRQ